MRDERTADEILTRWVHDYAHCVQGYVFGVVRCSAAAEDLTQETFVRAWRAMDRYQDQGVERAYLLRIADRLACDYLRRNRPEKTVGDEAWEALQPTSDDTPSHNLEFAEARTALSGALDCLTPQQRRVLLLRFFGDLDFAEIAHALELPLNTVLSHCRRGLLALRKQLAPADHEPTPS